MKSRPENKWFKTLYLEFVNFRFSGWKSQTQQKLAKMIIHLTSFAQKTSFILQTSTHLPLLKIFSRNTAKSLPLQIYQQICFCLLPAKTFALNHFTTFKNCIFEALAKQMYVYSCKENLLFQIRRKLL